MKTTKVDDLGRVGYIADKEPHATPANAWSSMQNTRCVDGSIAAFEGHESASTITELPETMLTVKTGQQDFIVYAGQSDIYSVRGGVEVQIGSGFGTSGTWDSCVLGGVGILNTFAENPQYWGGSGNTVDLPYDSTDPSNVCTWTDVGMRAKIIRPFGFALFAMNIEDCDGYNPRKVHYSHQADPGSVPITWDPTKPDYNTGITELSDTPGAIIDGLALRDTFQIYKEDAIFSATFTGDSYIYNFRVVTTSYGLFARDCVCDVGGRHVFIGDGDIYLYDGTNFQSIADERVKDLFFDDVSRTYKHKTFVIYYERTGEVWVCYPSADSVSCDKALVWNSKDNTWSPRQLPGVTAGTFGVVDRSSGWDYDDGDGNGPYTYLTRWDAAIQTYGAFLDDNPYRESLILGGATDLFEMDRTNTADGSNMTCYARREELDLGDKADWHTVSEVYVKAEGDPFNVRVGFQDTLNGAITWSAYQAFDPDTDYRLNFRVTGRLHAIEFQSAADVAWKISGYDVDYAHAGRR